MVVYFLRWGFILLFSRDNQRELVPPESAWTAHRRHPVGAFLTKWRMEQGELLNLAESLQHQRVGQPVLQCLKCSRALFARNAFVTFNKHFSIGLKSGEWGGTAEFRPGGFDQSAHFADFVRREACPSPRPSQRSVADTARVPERAVMFRQWQVLWLWSRSNPTGLPHPGQ